jgi:hypothetical protein
MLSRFVALSLAGVAVAAPAAQPGLKIVTRENWPHSVAETTTYVQGDRRRVETRIGDHETIQITRCDREQIVVLDAASRSYLSAPVQPYSSRLVALLTSLGSRRQKPQPAPTRLIETTTIQTGERKPAFGQVARRVIITRREVPLQGVGTTTETRFDGWYVDVETRPSCERFDGHAHAVLTASRQSGTGRPELPVVAFKDVGAPERGFPIELTTSWQEPARQGAAAPVSRRVVTQLSYQPLDPGLFEIPHGYRPSVGPIAALAARCARTWEMAKSVLVMSRPF